MSNDNIELLIDDMLPRPTGKTTLNEANKSMANKRAFSGGRKKQRGGNNTNSTTDLAAQSTEVDPHPSASKTNIDSTTALLNVTAQLNSDATGAAEAKKESNTEQTGGKTKRKKTRRRRRGKKTRGRRTKRRRISGKRRGRR